MISYNASYDIGEVIMGTVEKKAHIAVLHQYVRGGTKELNVVRCNGESLKFDIRYWNISQPCNGITLEYKDAEILYSALKFALENYRDYVD